MKSPLSITISTYNSDYANEWRNLSLAWLIECDLLEEIDSKILSSPQSFIVEKGGEIFMAFCKEKLVGTASMIFINSGIYELAKLSVDKDFRGNGIGNLLVLRCINFAKEKLAKEIILYTNSKLKTAINIYEKNGFINTKSVVSTYIKADIKMKLRF